MNKTGQIECDLCSKGSYQDRAGQEVTQSAFNVDLACSHLILFAQLCVLCPLGTHASDPVCSCFILCCIHYWLAATDASLPENCRFLQNARSCQRCKVGFYADVTGLVDCKMCPGGTFQNLEGDIYCKARPFWLDLSYLSLMIRALVALG